MKTPKAFALTYKVSGKMIFVGEELKNFIMEYHEQDIEKVEEVTMHGELDTLNEKQKKIIKNIVDTHNSKPYLDQIGWKHESEPKPKQDKKKKKKD